MLYIDTGQKKLCTSNEHQGVH